MIILAVKICVIMCRQRLVLKELVDQSSASPGVSYLIQISLLSLTYKYNHFSSHLLNVRMKRNIYSCSAEVRNFFQFQIFKHFNLGVSFICSLEIRIVSTCSYFLYYNKKKKKTKMS